MTRTEVADYLLMVLAWEGVVGSKGVMADAVERWRDTPRLSFADAYLSARALQGGCPVYSKNVADLRRQGADVPASLPA